MCRHLCTSDCDCWAFPSVLWLGDRNGIWPVKSLMLVCWWCFDWSFVRLIAAVVTTTSITLSSNEIQNGDILVLANPSPPGKWPLNGKRDRLWLFGWCDCDNRSYRKDLHCAVSSTGQWSAHIIFIWHDCSCLGCQQWRRAYCSPGSRRHGISIITENICSCWRKSYVKYLTTSLHNCSFTAVIAQSYKLLCPRPIRWGIMHWWLLSICLPLYLSSHAWP